MEVLERAVARVVCAQTALELGFSAARGGALDLLVAALQRFLAETAHRAHEAADSVGRASATLPDVLRSLAEGSTADPGADVAKLVQHLRACAEGGARELPFAQPLGTYPARKRLRGGGAPSYAELPGVAPPTHLPLPLWLPLLPDAHTYEHSEAHAPAGDGGGEGERDARVKRQLAQQTVGAEAALAGLADALQPDAPTDYAAAAPARWGGALDTDRRKLATRAAAEQAAAAAEAPPEALQQNAMLRAATGATAGAYSAELLRVVGVGAGGSAGGAAALPGGPAADGALALPAAGGEQQVGWLAGEATAAGALAARCARVTPLPRVVCA